MPRPGSTIPKAPVAKIMLNAGSKRVSDEAVKELVDFLTEYTINLSERAIRIAKHSGRKTIQGGDIKVALR